MNEESSESPGKQRLRCVARTRAGNPCPAPPLKPKPGSDEPPLCVFHSQRPDAVEKRGVVRRPVAARDPALAPLAALPDLRVETVEELSRFQTTVLRLLLRHEIEPQVARAAVEIATLIHGEKTKESDEASFKAFSDLLKVKLARDAGIGPEELGEQGMTG